MKGKRYQKGGSLILTDKKVIRTYGRHSPTESIDTAGYSNGRDRFKLDVSYPGQPKQKLYDVSRKEVLPTIDYLKDGATRVVDWRTKPQKKANGGKISAKTKNIKASKTKNHK
jgi:hypothetical protein